MLHVFPVALDLAEGFFVILLILLELRNIEAVEIADACAAFEGDIHRHLTAHSARGGALAQGFKKIIVKG